MIWILPLNRQSVTQMCGCKNKTSTMTFPIFVSSIHVKRPCEGEMWCWSFPRLPDISEGINHWGNTCFVQRPWVHTLYYCLLLAQATSEILILSLWFLLFAPCLPHSPLSYFPCKGGYILCSSCSIVRLSSANCPISTHSENSTQLSSIQTTLVPLSASLPIAQSVSRLGLYGLGRSRS